MVASVTRLRIAAATVEYFEADGYYTRGDPEHRRASRWYGAATKVCGLANRTVTARAFAAVLEGRVPRTDLRLGRLRDGAHQHLPGIDVTFSAPKSVSLEALVYAPAHTRARLRNAHDGAVRAALDFLERELLQTRGYDRATRRRPRVAAHGLLAALFRHATNRNLDPQLHTHGVIANMTRNARGAWRSAEFTAVFRAKKLLGAYYRAELQRRVEAIGYATVPTLVGTVPGFEIAGYPKALLEAFSTRRRDLLAWLEARGLAYTPANAQLAVLATRRRKAAPDRDALPALWRRRASACARGRDPRAVRRRGAPVPPAPSPLEVARRAVEHLAERSTLFTAHDLRGYALAYGGGRQTLPAIDAAVAALQRDRLLLEIPADGADRAFTTRGAAAAEREVLRRMREGLDAGCALADPDRVAATLAPGSLNAGQRATVTMVLLAPHRLVGVQGYAGTGKTTMLRAVARLAAGVPLLGLAPSTGAARVLGREAGIPTRTLQWFLVRHGDIADGAADGARLAAAQAVHGGGLLVVDEASMIGTTAMVRLLRIADRVGVARVVLVGDRAQLRAVEAGQPFRLLQRAGMPTARMTEVLRQRDRSLRTVVEHLIAERPSLAIAELGPGVLEVGGGADPDADLAATMADLWLALDPGARARTLLLAPTHALRADVHGMIRRRLADEGVLRGPALTLDRYVNLRLTHAQKRELVHYREGDVLVFHQRDFGVGVAAGDACHVLGTDGGRVLLEPPDGSVRRMDPDRRVRYRFELYETRTIELRAGDRIRWTRPHRGGGLELDNGARATILAIGRRRVRFRADDGTAYALARADPQLHHLDHAYTSTVHGAQGLTADAVIAILRADHGPLTDLTTAYVELSRARDDAVLLTDDREALGAALDQRSGEECSALEALGVELPDAGPELPPTPSAPAPRPEMPPPIAERPRLWAEAVHWWEFAEGARAAGKEPFAAAGGDAAIAPVLARADQAPDGLPAGIARVVEAHQAWCRRRERERRAAEARRRRLEDEQRVREAAAMERRLATATGGLQGAMARRLQAAARASRAAGGGLGAAVAHRLEAMPGTRQRMDTALLRLAEREHRAVSDWRQRRIDQATARSRGAGRDLPAVPDERTTAAGHRLLPPLIRSLAAADRDLPADVRAVREGTRATARTLEAALQYDDDAAAMVDRVRARRQQADRDAVPWFSGEDGAGLCTAIERLSDEARSGPLAALVVLPPALAQARRELRRATRRLAVALRVSERLAGVLKARADGLQAADHDGIWFQASRAYGPWRREADAVLRLTEKMGAARTRYEPLMKARDELARSTRAHTDLRPPPGPVSWTSFASSADALRNQLRRDDAIQRLERTRKARYGQARLPWRPIPYHRKGYRAYIDELQHFHLTGAPGEVPPAFAAVVDEHRIQAALNQTVTEFLADGLPRLEALSDRRDVIRRHAAARGATVLDLGDHFTWSDDAAALVTTAQELLDGPEYKPHLRAARVRAERIRKALAPVQRQLDVDREAEGVLRDWRDLVSGARQWRPPEDPSREPQSDTRGTAPGRPPFFEDGYDALIERVRAVHEKTRDTEPVPEFAEALDDHEALAATQGLVDHFLECIRDCTAKRRRLLERAARDSAPFRIAYPRQHAEWEDLGTAAELASDMLMADITQYGPHLRRDPRGWTAVWHSRFEVFASENLGGLPAAQLLRLHDHGAAIANQGNDPWTARELYDIQSAMWASLQQVSGVSPDPAAEDERRRGRDALAVLSNKRQVRALPLFLQMLAQSREGLDADAAAKGCAVVDLPGWEKWHKEAGQATEATRKLLADPDCRRFLERWPEHARDLHDRLPPLEARQREDHEILRTRRRQQAPARTGPHRARGRGRRKRSSPGGQDR